MAELSIDLRRRLVAAYRTLRRHREAGDVVYKPEGGNNQRRVDLEWLRGHLARQPNVKSV